MQKQAFQLLALFTLILIIWFIIPMIAINGVALLPTTVDKLLSVSAVTILWLIIIMFKSSHPLEKSSQNPSDHFIVDMIKLCMEKIKSYTLSNKVKKATQPKETDTSEDVFSESNQILECQIKDFVQNCKTQHNFQPLNSFLVLGHCKAGKTTLIQNSDTPFETFPTKEDIAKPDALLETQSHEAFLNDTKNVLWHRHDNYLLIDTPGEYANSDVSGERKTPWLTLLNGLVKYFRVIPLKGIILVLDLSSLLSSSQQNLSLQLHLLKQRFKDINNHYGEVLSVKVIFSKWDTIEGFTQFFDHLTQSERDAVMGTDFSAEISQGPISKQFKHYYENLVLQLNQMLIMRLHQEHNSEKRLQISRFPLQMEQIQTQLTGIIQSLLEKSVQSGIIKASGIYFTSCLQSDSVINLVNDKLSKNLDLPALLPKVNTAACEKNFFSAQLFAKLCHTICATAKPQKTTLPKKQRWLIYGSALSVFFIITALLMVRFVDSMNALSMAENSTYQLSLIENKVSNPNARHAALGAINQQINQAGTFWLTGSPKVENYPVDKPAVSTYTAKTQSLSPQLTAQLNTAFQNTLSQNNLSPLETFSELKAYLMLTEPTHLNAGWLFGFLQNDPSMDGIINEDSAKVIIQTLQQGKAVLTNNQQLISTARNTLKGLPPQYVAFLSLQDAAQFASQPMLSIHLMGSKIQIPFLFTAQGMQTVFLNNLPEAVRLAAKPNWLLGQLPKSLNLQNIKEQTLQLYLRNYAQWWQHAENGLQLPKIQNLQALNQLTQQLADNNSGLVAALQIIAKNTNPNAIFPAGSHNAQISTLRNTFQSEVGQHFAYLQQLDEADLQSSIGTFAEYLQSIASHHQTDKAAFHAVKTLFQNTQNLSQSPLSEFANAKKDFKAPLNLLFSELTHKTKTLLAQAASHYIQKKWQQDVYGFYEQQLANRYPLSSKSATSIKLESFTQFFAPQGILNKFFNRYLASFIDSSSPDWQIKHVADIQMPLSPQMLQSLEKARIIEAMFFPDSSSSLHVQFTLQQIALMPIVKSFQLNINGQSLNDQQGSRNVNTFVWPGNSNNNTTTLSFQNVNGQNAKTNLQGPWGWFHLLDESYIHEDGNTKNYVVTFDVDGNEARYKMTTESPINPFIPGILNSFSLPKAIASNLSPKQQTHT